MIIIRVAGNPAPQGSKTRNRYGAVYESSAALKPWRDAIRAETQRALGYLSDPDSPRAYDDPATAVEVWVLFLFRRPAGHFRTGKNAHLLRDSAPMRPVGKKNDLDKLLRAVFDGITEGGALADDGQIVDSHPSRDYCRPGESPGCLIRIEPAVIVPATDRLLFDPAPPAGELVIGGRHPGLYVEGQRVT